MDHVVIVGKTYRHFKGKEYKVLCIALDSDNNDEVVVYEALYGRHLIWTMPYELFTSKVDPEKYPDSQEYRFELVG